MKIRARIIIVVVFVAVLPLLVVAWTTLGVHGRALDKQSTEIRTGTASFGSELAQVEVRGAAQALEGLVSSVDWASLSGDERDGALWLIFGQLDDIAVVYIENEQGETVSVARLNVGEAKGQWHGHPEVDKNALASFREGTALDKFALGKSTQQIAPPVPTAGHLLLPVVFPILGHPTEQWNLIVGISLSRLCESFALRRPSGTDSYLIDARGQSICGTWTYLGALPASESVEIGDFHFTAIDGTSMLAAIATNTLGWRAIVTQVVSIAESPKREMRRRSLFWIVLGVIGACMAGVYLAYGIARPIESLDRKSVV